MRWLAHVLVSKSFYAFDAYSDIMIAQSGYRDRCRVVRDIACQANCTIA